MQIINSKTGLWKLKRKISYNKRGISIDEAVPFVIFIIVVTFGIFLYSISEHVKGNSLKTDIQTQINILNGNNLLLDYIRQIDDKGNSKSDLISKYITEKKYDDLKNDLKEYLNKNSPNSNWYAEVKDSSQNVIIKLNNIGYLADDQYLTQVPYQVGSVFVPINNPEHSYISIELSFAS